MSNMSLGDNPIFLTQKRLVHRGGVLAAILIAALIGGSLLAGLISYVASPRNFNSFGTGPEMRAKHFMAGRLPWKFS